MVEKIKDAARGKDHESALQPKSVQQPSLNIGSPKTWPIIVTGLSLSAIAIGGVYTIVRVASVFNEIGAIATFITGSVVGLFTLLAIIVQAAIYWQQRNFMMRQWKAMQENVDRTDTIIEKMQGQLDISKSQNRTLASQIDVGRQQKDVMAGQLQAMTDQIGLMENSLKVTRDSVNVARDALKTDKRAYIGIDRMNIDLKNKKRLWVHLKNGGRTPASNVTAKMQVTISTPMGWHEERPPNVRLFALGEEDYGFNLTTIHPNSIIVQIGFPLGQHFSDEELQTVIQKKSRLTVNLSLDYDDGFDKEFAYFALTYRGKDTHGYDTWGIFPTESEKKYDQTNPEHPEFRIL